MTCLQHQEISQGKGTREGWDQILEEHRSWLQDPAWGYWRYEPCSKTIALTFAVKGCVRECDHVVSSFCISLAHVFFVIRGIILCTGTYIDKKCPFTGNVSIRGRILTGTVNCTKMTRTITIRRDYLHFVPKYQRLVVIFKNFFVVLTERPKWNSFCPHKYFWELEWSGYYSKLALKYKHAISIKVVINWITWLSLEIYSTACIFHGLRQKAPR